MESTIEMRFSETSTKSRACIYPQRQHRPDRDPPPANLISSFAEEASNVRFRRDVRQASLGPFDPASTLCAALEAISNTRPRKSDANSGNWQSNILALLGSPHPSGSRLHVACAVFSSELRTALLS